MRLRGEVEVRPARLRGQQGTLHPMGEEGQSPRGGGWYGMMGGGCPGCVLATLRGPEAQLGVLCPAIFPLPPGLRLFHKRRHLINMDHT